MRCYHLLPVLALLVASHTPLRATVTIQSLTPSVSSPQPLGTPVTWTVTATHNSLRQLMFQFNVAFGAGSFTVMKDFNAGTLSGGVWTSQPYIWTTINAEGMYRIQVVVKDFATGETDTKTAAFMLTSRVAGSAAVNPTANPLVALFSSPSCAAGSSMRVVFTGPAQLKFSETDWKPCNSKSSMNFYVAGMYPSTTYSMNYQIITGGTVTSGPTVLSFTTGSPPPNITFPTFTETVPPGPQTDFEQPLLIHGMGIIAGSQSIPVATDLAGKILWYYAAPDLTSTALLTRPLANETLLTIQSGPAWQPITQQQVIRLIDLAGNTLQETNTGIIQNQLRAMGAADARSCTAIPRPAPIGAACLGAFHHDVIALANGDLVAIADIEKIFPAGTQGDASGLPVDIMGDMLVVLNSNLQAVWYWEAFQHDGGGSQLDIKRAAILGETCAPSGTPGCPPIFLLGTGIAPLAHDWMHTNSVYYWPQSADFIVSIRHQDWVIKVDYRNGSGTGNILWRMGLDGDFAFNNTNNDPYPWFSHQHEVGMENHGAGPLTIFDNGNTRVAPPPIGLGSGNSRGMALTVDETNMTVTPVLSQDLGVYGLALGSAQLLTNGNFFFQPGLVNGQFSYCPEILPTPGTVNGAIIDNLQGPTSYRTFRQADMYHPPRT